MSNLQLAANGIVAPYDPRSICNLMLDEAEGRFPVTNLSLQKLLYFTHGIHLIEAGEPLVTGYFEAWKLGPVHPAAYKAFRVAGEKPINFRAVRRDPLTGAEYPLLNPTDLQVTDRVRRIVLACGGMDPRQLVDISHAAGAPWRFVVDNARSTTALGMRIPDQVIRDRFKYHKFVIGPLTEEGQLGEDAPFA